MRKIFLAIELLLSVTLFGQDLGRLRDRAERLLALRAAGNKAQAVQYIELDGRDGFLESRPFPMRDVHLTGFDFTADPKIVFVRFDAKVMLPDLGLLPRTGREPWVWDKKDWFLRIENSGDPFVKNSQPLPVKPLLFELSTTKLDLGRHVQGDFIKEVVEFKSDRDELSMVRAKEFPGLLASLPIWTSATSGRLELTLDTTLISEDIDYPVDLEVLGYENQMVHASFEIRSQIEPRLRFRQIPEQVDPMRAGTMELQIENLSNKPFHFYGVSLTNPAYELTTQIPPIVPAGALVKFGIKYGAQPEPLGAQLMFKLSEPIVGKIEFGFPLNVKFPAAVTPEFTKEQLEEFIRSNKR